MHVARLSTAIWSCASQLRSQARETWIGEITEVPSGDVCVTANGEVFSESGQSVRPGSAQQTVVTRVPEVITVNDDSQDPACGSSMTSS